MVPAARRSSPHGGPQVKLTVKLFASLGEFLPPEARNHQVQMEFPDGTTPVQVLDRLKVPVERAHLVIVDGVFVPPSERSTRALAEGQEIAFFPPVAGG